jgi:hypothetical protein
MRGGRNSQQIWLGASVHPEVFTRDRFSAGISSSLRVGGGAAARPAIGLSCGASITWLRVGGCAAAGRTGAVCFADLKDREVTGTLYRGIAHGGEGSLCLWGASSAPDPSDLPELWKTPMWSAPALVADRTAFSGYHDIVCGACRLCVLVAPHDPVAVEQDEERCMAS